MSLSSSSSHGNLISRNFLNAPAAGSIFPQSGAWGEKGAGGIFSNDKNHPFLEINRKLDSVGVPHELNERFLEELLTVLTETHQSQCLAHDLTLARLTEAALLCAGHYADHCEFSAAGDLLVNPRKIKVNIKAGAAFLTKTRHGLLTDQLAEYFPASNGTMAVNKCDTAYEVLEPALLPDLFSRLMFSRRFSRQYLDHVQTRMGAVSDTLAFLFIGRILSSQDLHVRLLTEDPGQKAFIESNLCRFDDTWFRFLGTVMQSV